MVQDDFDRAWELWTHITEEQIMLERDDATPHEKRELAALAEHPEQLIARVKDWADLNRRTADISPYRALVHKYLDETRFFASPVDFGLMTARFPSLQPVEVRKQDIAPGYLPQWILASSGMLSDVPDVRDRRAELSRRRVFGQPPHQHGVSSWRGSRHRHRSQAGDTGEKNTQITRS